MPQYIFFGKKQFDGYSFYVWKEVMLIISELILVLFFLTIKSYYLCLLQDKFIN